MSVRPAAALTAFTAFIALAASLASGCSSSAARDERLVIATTHTLEDSGLLDSLTAAFARDHPEQRLDVVVAGSGEVLTMGRRGDVDALLTHAPEDETAFVAAGYGMARLPVAHNEFLIAGPPEDPATIRHAPTAVDAFARIRRYRQAFVSRADDSGTHKKEKSIWKAARIAPDETHLVEAGTGMADALRVADQRRAYILTDLATYLTLQKNLILVDLFHGDAVLRNDYSVIVVSSARNRTGAEMFAAWIRSESVQKMIGEFGRAQLGRSIFIPDASIADSAQ